VDEKNSIMAMHQKVEREVAQYRSDFKALLDKVQQHDQAAALLQSKAADHRDEAAVLRQTSFENAARLAAAQEDARRANARADENKTAALTLERSLGEFRAQLEAERKQREQTALSLQQLRTSVHGQLSTAEVKERFENQDRAIAALQQSLQGANDMVREAHARQQEKDNHIQQLLNKIEGLEAQGRGGQWEAARLTAERDRLQAQLASAKESNSKLVASLNAGAVSLAEAREEAERQQREAAAVRQAHEDLARRGAAALDERRAAAAALEVRLAAAESEAVRMSGALAAANSIRAQLDEASNASASSLRALEVCSRALEAMSAERDRLRGELGAARAAAAGATAALEDERARGARAAEQVLAQRRAAEAAERAADAAGRAAQEAEGAAAEARRRAEYLSVHPTNT
jgi:chromosome segregation ATPase